MDTVLYCTQPKYMEDLLSRHNTDSSVIIQKADLFISALEAVKSNQISTASLLFTTPSEIQQDMITAIYDVMVPLGKVIIAFISEASNPEIDELCETLVPCGFVFEKISNTQLFGLKQSYHPRSNSISRRTSQVEKPEVLSESKQTLILVTPN